MYLVGRVIKPRGLKGELKVEIITSFPEHLLQLKQLFVKKNEQWQAHSVVQSKRSGKYAYLKFQDVHTLEQAEDFRNMELYIEQDQLTELDNDEYYVHDLIGVQVLDEKGSVLGEITDVETYTSNDVYVVLTKDGKEVLVPAIRDIVKEVSIKNKQMTIHVMDGLLE